MKIHPEMQELMKTEMAEGLRYWRDKSPEQIKARLRQKMLQEQAALMNIDALKDKTRGVAWEYRRTRCTCPVDPFGNAYHTPWCEGTASVVFVTPEREDDEDNHLGNIVRWNRWGGL